MNKPLSVELLKSLGYSTDDARRILSTASQIEAERIHARSRYSEGHELPTPIQACSEDPVKQRIFTQARSIVRHLSGYTFDLDPAKPVNVYELNKAIRAASVEDRIGVKENLARLGLIA